ncbi:circadian-associated transcriptional repressor-like [Colossoma macropomum]|uniref:circadian-associated transcriptional repressor-like n=1 Tax=Colossoma macropomum TaxID=42526 RepID=UPI001863FDAF|nr:circadian-associated transcriptional repressor-like [Colossoma macropomum]XP_036446493.1 circadian-associated transcriptional repressor-like [Colossoma macropomum]
MQSAGSTSSQPPLDTPSSGDSFLFSDDDSEVFLLEESEGRSSQSVCSLDGGLDSPGSQWARDGFGESSEVSRDHSRSASGSNSSSSLSLSSSSSSGLGWSSAEGKGGKEKEKSGGTQGDAFFAQKCLELQGFVRPLLELLNGLKKGRFDKGLSSFQQSVAMDRIQRIVGVLQKPHIGEKYLPTLLQIEMMLKLWFPQVTLRPAGTTVSTDLSGQGTSSTNTPPHKHKDQLHIPVKKRRLSWSDTDSSSTPPPVACKQVKVHEKLSQQTKEEGGEGSSGCRPQIDQSEKREGKTSGHKAIHWSEPSLTWVHVAPIFSPPKSCPSHEGGDGAKQSGRGYVLLTIPPPTSRGSPATQDSSISSTTPFSEPVGCQSQPVDTETTNPASGWEQSPPITTQPSSRAELRPLET